MVAVRMQRDEVEQDRDGDRCGHGGQEHVPKRVVVLLVQGETLHEWVADLEKPWCGAEPRTSAGNMKWQAVNTSSSWREGLSACTPMGRDLPASALTGAQYS